MTGTDLYVNKCKQSRSYLNHLVYICARARACVCVCIHIHNVQKHNAIYILTFLWCFISLMMVSCLRIETCYIKAIQHTHGIL